MQKEYFPHDFTQEWNNNTHDKEGIEIKKKKTGVKGISGKISKRNYNENCNNYIEICKEMKLQRYRYENNKKIYP